MAQQLIQNQIGFFFLPLKDGAASGMHRGSRERAERSRWDKGHNQATKNGFGVAEARRNHPNTSHSSSKKDFLNPAQPSPGNGFFPGNAENFGFLNFLATGVPEMTGGGTLWLTVHPKVGLGDLRGLFQPELSWNSLISAVLRPTRHHLLRDAVYLERHLTFSRYSLAAASLGITECGVS